MAPKHSILTAARAAERQRLAAEAVAARAPSAPVLVLAPSLEAGSRVLRRAAQGRPAAFGWQRATVGELAARVGAARLAALGRAPVAPVALVAVCARMVHRLRDEGALGRYAPVGDRPGLPRALARTFGELALAGVEPSAEALPPDLARLYAAYRRELEAGGHADRGAVLRAAIERARDPAPHPLLDVPVVLLDVPVASALDAELVAALAARAEVRAFVPSGDGRAARRLARALGAPVEEAPVRGGSSALDRLAARLFARAEAEGADAADDSVELFSAPGESRECVEIARRVLAAAAEGVPFDRMAVLAHAPERYRAHLVEALRRAGVPAYFSRGTVRPDPAGRALLALLACKEEGLSARAFGEYLSLGVVPDPDESGGPPAARGDVRWLAPEDELARPREVEEDAPAGEPRELDPDAPAVAGTLRAPWRWERLIVDAAVIGGADRWRRRLEGLSRGIEAQLARIEDPEDPDADRLRRRLRDLAHLAGFALPLLEELDALPRQATWGEWGERLARLAERAVRDPARVLAVLRELAPMAPIGPVGLTEVTLVLSRRLTEMISPPSGSPAGKLYVASIAESRGLSFDIVFVPGLAEKVFPRKVTEDPIALDEVRARVSPELATTESRVEEERLALRLAIGAAERRVVVSYPRLDTERGRPRVPSFYGLEILRATLGQLPSFEELAGVAEEAGAARMAWPAPARPEDAIDGAEYDLAVLHELLHRRDRASIHGEARYLMSANPHLARALRARFARWDERWYAADGLVNPSEAARALTLAHRPSERSFSPTALEKLAACPYRFFLSAIVKLQPREVPEAIEELDPRERGSLVHGAQATLLSRLRERAMLPVTPARLEEARALLAEVVREVEADYRERLAPAIERVWRDAIDEIHGDLAEWLVRMSEQPEWTPDAFELAFGLRELEGADPASVTEPVRLEEGLTLRGRIDLVERREDGALRATDFKTGATPASVRVIGGGRVLQPVLYARAVEALFPERRVIGGRLYYCTTRGRFDERNVPLDESAREAVKLLASTVDHYVSSGFLPAAPAEGECERCDYRPVCGPAEERRARRKHRPRLGPLERLRKQP